LLIIVRIDRWLFDIAGIDRWLYNVAGNVPGMFSSFFFPVIDFCSYQHHYRS